MLWEVLCQLVTATVCPQVILGNPHVIRKDERIARVILAIPARTEPNRTVMNKNASRAAVIGEVPTDYGHSA